MPPIFHHYLDGTAFHSSASSRRTNLGIGLMEIGDRNGGEASVREAIRGRPEMFGHAIMALAASPHGRFFLRPSAAAKFLKT